MSSIKKPNFKENKSVYHGEKKIQDDLKALSGVAESYFNQAKSLMEQLRQEQCLQKLDNMSVDELSKAKLGIRVSALKRAGYTRISQLIGKTSASLQYIDGIGSTSADGIQKTVRKIVDTVKSTTKLQINPQNQTGTTDILVHNLYLARKLNEVEKNALKKLEETKDEIKKLEKDTLPARSWIVWNLSSDAKKEYAIQRTEEFLKYIETHYGEETDEIFEKEQQALKAKHDEYWEDFTKNAASYYTTIENIQKAISSKGFLKKEKEQAEKNGLPQELAIAISKIELNLNGLRCVLRPYQKFGVQYILNQGAVLLGDDMGLGKTIEAIASMVSLRNSGESRFVVVCPASVLINWEREINKFSDLTVHVAHGRSIKGSCSKWNQQGGVLLTTYETLSKIPAEEDMKFSMLVVDEAHYVKNPSAARTINLLTFRQHTDRALFMTGTPIENKVEEMVFLIGCLQPNIANKIKGITAVSMAPDFRKIVAPVYFRRTKEDVLSELPQKIENEEWCSLTKAEHDLYASFLKSEDASFADLRRVSWVIDKPETSSKAIRLKEVVSEAMDNGRKIIIFSYFLGTIEAVRSMLNVKQYGPINGSIAPSERQRIIDEFTESKEPAVLLSQVEAGGTGLNIQAASVVIFCEPQLKPSIENQAIARAYRMGQVYSVSVHRLLCEKTVDERIVNALKHKQELFDNFADESVSGKESLIDSGMMKKMIEEEKKRWN